MVVRSKGKWSSIENQFAFVVCQFSENHFVDIENY